MHVALPFAPHIRAPASLLRSHLGHIPGVGVKVRCERRGPKVRREREDGRCGANGAGERGEKGTPGPGDERAVIAEGGAAGRGQTTMTIFPPAAPSSSSWWAAGTSSNPMTRPIGTRTRPAATSSRKRWSTSAGRSAASPE